MFEREVLNPSLLERDASGRPIERRNGHPAAARFVAGMQSGMAGALVMLAWFALSMLWARHSIWWFPNLMATTFGGDAALRLAWNRYTAAGIALHLIQYSLVGALFAILIPRSARLPLTLSGIAVSLAWYYLMYKLVWPHWNALIPLYSPDRQVILGHVFFGMLIGRFRKYEMPV